MVVVLLINSDDTSPLALLRLNLDWTETTRFSEYKHEQVSEARDTER